MKKVTIQLDDGVYSGDYFDGVRQGYGVYEWNNGDKYEGNYRNNKKEGRGKYFWASNGDCYEGEYMDNLKHGHGIFISHVAGTVYSGQFLRGKKHGKGVLKFKDGTIFEGDFIEGRRKKGTLRLSCGDIYDGEFVNEKFQGKGVYSYADGRHYSGDFKNNKKHGFGVFKGTVDSSVSCNTREHILFYGESIARTPSDIFQVPIYEGYFENDLPKGQGQLISKNNDIYSGEFSQGFLNGTGICKYHNGTVYKGLWKDGRWNGSAKTEYSSNIIYQGAYLWGRKHGDGSVIMADGTIFEGHWENGILTSGKALGKIGDSGIDAFTASDADMDTQYRRFNKDSFVDLSFMKQADMVASYILDKGGIKSEANEDIFRTMMALERQNFALYKELNRIDYGSFRQRLTELEEVNALLREACDRKGIILNLSEQESDKSVTLANIRRPSLKSVKTDSNRPVEAYQISEGSPTDSRANKGGESGKNGGDASTSSSFSEVVSMSKHDSLLLTTPKSQELSPDRMSMFWPFGSGTKPKVGSEGLSKDANGSYDNLGRSMSRDTTKSASHHSVSHLSDVLYKTVNIFPVAADSTKKDRRTLRLAAGDPPTISQSNLSVLDANYKEKEPPSSPSSSSLHSMREITHLSTSERLLPCELAPYSTDGLNRFELFIIEALLDLPSYDAIDSGNNYSNRDEYNLPSTVGWRYSDGKTNGIDSMNEFCFPNGVSYDIVSSSSIPYLTGSEWDKFHILQFNDNGSAAYACCLTVFTAQLLVDAAKSCINIESNTDDGEGVTKRYMEIADRLLALSIRKKAAYVINYWIYCMLRARKRRRWTNITNSSDQSPESSLVSPATTNNGGEKRISFLSKMFRRSAGISTDSRSTYDFATPSRSVKGIPVVNTDAASADATTSIKNRDYCTDIKRKVIVTQKSYCIISAKPLHSYFYKVLKCMADSERKLLAVGCGNNALTLEKMSLICSKRYQFLTAVHSTLLESTAVHSALESTAVHSALESTAVHSALLESATESDKPVESPVNSFVEGNVTDGYKFSVTGYIDRFEIKLKECPSTKDWTTAVLFSCCSSRIIFKVINLLLMEKSIVISGLNAGLVTVVAVAIRDLIQPFNWAGVFVPLVPLSAAELFEAPVPYILGTTDLPCDLRHLSPSAAILSLDDPLSNHYCSRSSLTHTKISRTYKSAYQGTEAWFTKLPEIHTDMPIPENLELHMNTVRRMLFTEKRNINTSTNNYGYLYDLAYLDSMSLRARNSVCRLVDEIKDHNIKYCGDVNDAAAWRHYVRYNPSTGEDEFYSSWFMQIIKRHVDFQESLVNTQLFVAYIDSLRRAYSDRDHERNFISDFIKYRWRLHKRKSKAAAGNPVL